MYFGKCKKGHYSVCILDQLDDVMRILGQRSHCSARDQLTVVLQWIEEKSLKVSLKIVSDIYHIDLR